MKRKGLIRGFFALMLAAAMLSGCGNTTATQATVPVVTPGAGTPTAIDTPENSGTTVAQAAELGTVQIAVKFPSFGKTGNIGKALIDLRTSVINLTVQSGAYGGSYYQNIDLTPDPVTGIATASLEMPVGVYFFSATAYDTNFVELENTGSAGEIVSGSNSVVLTFATGDWQFVAADDTPTPLGLTDGAGTPVALVGFALKPVWVFSGAAGPAKAAIDPTLPSGWAEYGLGFFTTGAQQIGPVLWSDARHQFSARTSTSSFSSGWLNLDDPTRSEALFGMYTPPLAGQRMAFILENGLELQSNENFTITDDATNADLLPSLQGVADSRFVDGKTMSGHLLEMTFVSETITVLDPAFDCNLFWSSPAPTPGAARSAAIAKALAAANRVGKAAPGDVVTLSAAITVEMDECDGGFSQIDGDGDGDMAQDMLYIDINLNGQYDPADGDMYTDYNLDGNYDYVVSATPIDGDGDGDLAYEWLIVDKNNNGRFDPADGDQFEDYDLDGVFDYTYMPGTLAHRTEQYSNVQAREFRAKAQQANTVFTDFGLPPTTAVIIQ